MHFLPNAFHGLFVFYVYKGMLTKSRKKRAVVRSGLPGKQSHPKQRQRTQEQRIQELTSKELTKNISTKL